MEGFGDSVEIIADGLAVGAVDALISEERGQIGGVGIDDLAQQKLGSDAEDFCFHLGRMLLSAPVVSWERWADFSAQTCIVPVWTISSRTAAGAGASTVAAVTASAASVGDGGGDVAREGVESVGFGLFLDDGYGVGAVENLGDGLS